MKIQVFFESHKGTPRTKLIAEFFSEEILHKCRPTLEKLARDKGYFVSTWMADVDDSGDKHGKASS